MKETLPTTKTEKPEFEACCSSNCGTDLCPKQFLLNKFDRGETFEDRMNVFKEIKADNNIRPLDKLHAAKYALNRLWQKAHSHDELQQVLNEFPDTTHPTINFEEIKERIHNKMKSLENN